MQNVLLFKPAQKCNLIFLQCCTAYFAVLWCFLSYVSHIGCLKRKFLKDETHLNNVCPLKWFNALPQIHLSFRVTLGCYMEDGVLWLICNSSMRLVKKKISKAEKVSGRSFAGSR